MDTAMSGHIAALEAGAAWIGVALVEEGLGLREAAVDAPILICRIPPGLRELRSLRG